MTTAEWSSKTEKEKAEYIYELGVKSCRGLRAGKSADKEFEKILNIIIK